MYHVIKHSVKLFGTNLRSIRKYADDTKVATLKDGENILKMALQNSFPKAKEIKIDDISGGCGAIFEVFVSSVEFKGLTVVKQHQLINQVLENQIKLMHGIRIHTEIPDENKE